MEIELKIVDILQLTKKSDEEYYVLYKAGVDVSEYVDKYHKIISLLYSCLFNKDGIDLIYWWLYDKVEKNIWENNIKIDLTRIEDFVSYLVKNYSIQEA